VSQTAKEFVATCLTVDPTQRPTAAEVLKHRWLADKNPHPVLDPGSPTGGPTDLIAPPMGGSYPVESDLRTVLFPRDCLNRFTSIASINTARNQETCGLLLGKSKGGRYVVTTLLIPKQHATSDTCTIDEEVQVMRFTEERSLIILGWVRRHLCWWIGAH